MESGQVLIQRCEATSLYKKYPERPLESSTCSVLCTISLFHFSSMSTSSISPPRDRDDLIFGSHHYHPQLTHSTLPSANGFISCVAHPHILYSTLSFEIHTQQSTLRPKCHKGFAVFILDPFPPSMISST